MSCGRISGLAVLAAALAATAAGAQPLVLSPYHFSVGSVALPVNAPVTPARPAPDLANPLDALAPTTLQANAMQSAVFARTAVEHRFSRRQDITGSLGLLCGLQPGHTESGGGAYGSDPHGRFVGARLSFAFR
ncbi:hypothetical protein [Phenylobacterium sp.]|uniref:hypothetical protein n=1 Tax=Phenylobacterium sp. TaxID=1871053 RepID=UPI00286D5773|nr:hypothetical protein [Phenylobacterium sp.]